MDDIPFGKLGIPQNIEKQLQGESSRKVKMTLARGLMPLTAEAQLGVLYLLSMDDSPDIARVP